MVRIIAGRFRGLKLVAPKGRNTRPTADQVKEAIFSMLHSLPFEIEGARVLDFFAGSGALGLEALSRGALSVLLTDYDREALAALSRNIETAGASGEAAIMRTRWPKGFERLSEPFNLFLLDPPYDEAKLPLNLLKSAAGAGLAVPGAVAVWEQSPGTLKTWSASDSAPWEPVCSRSWGNRAAAFLRLTGSGTHENEGNILL